MKQNDGYNKEHPEIRFRTNRVIHKALKIRLKRLGCSLERFACQLFHVAMSDDGTIAKAEQMVEEEIRNEKLALPDVAHKRRQSYTFSLPTEFIRKIDNFKGWMSRGDFLMANIKWNTPEKIVENKTTQSNLTKNSELWDAMSTGELYLGEVPG